MTVLCIIWGEPTSLHSNLFSLLSLCHSDRNPRKSISQNLLSVDFWLRVYQERPQSLKCQGKQKLLLFIQSGDLLGFNKRCFAAPLHPPGSCSSGVAVTWDHRWKLPGILEVPNALMAGDATVTNKECFLWSLLPQPFLCSFKPLVHCIECLPACNTRLISSFLWLNSDW